MKTDAEAIGDQAAQHGWEQITKGFYQYPTKNHSVAALLYRKGHRRLATAFEYDESCRHVSLTDKPIRELLAQYPDLRECSDDQVIDGWWMSNDGHHLEVALSLLAGVEPRELGAL